MKAQYGGVCRSIGIRNSHLICREEIAARKLLQAMAKGHRGLCDTAQGRLVPRPSTPALVTALPARGNVVIPRPPSNPTGEGARA